MDLNSQQQEVVEHIHGPLLVLAPMGTGKTLVIARRAARAVQEGLDPDSILCLSFTNRAAREMRERITAVLGQKASEVTVRTLHGLCADLLRHEFQPLGVPPDFTICDEEDARALLADACNSQGIALKASDKMADQLFGFVEKVKLAQGVAGDAVAIGKMFEAFCAESDLVSGGLAGCDPVELLAGYNQALREYNQLDFPDLIACVDRLFRENPDFLALAAAVSLDPGR